MNTLYNQLRNGVNMPYLILGVPLIAEAENVTEKQFVETVKNAVSNGILGFDTSSSYGKSETLLGNVLKGLTANGCDSECLFLTTKISNKQQISGNIDEYVDIALEKLKRNQLDAMLLHWPFPEYFLDNWEKLVEVYDKHKVKAIGIANAKIRHLEMIRKRGLMMPHILQTEIHPLNTCKELRDYCNQLNITIQACTSLCSMIPLIKENAVLKQIAFKHQKELPQIILRWHVQNNISPIFRSFNLNHLKAMSDIWDFNLSEEEVYQISSLNINYRYHPESLNCPGF